MAIFHYTIKIVGRSKGKSVISASAYLNGDVMKNEETGRISYYTSKKEVVYTSLMMCENAPPEWQIVPEENIKRFQKSVRYKRSEDKEAAGTYAFQDHSGCPDESFSVLTTSTASKAAQKGFLPIRNNLDQSIFMAFT